MGTRCCRAARGKQTPAIRTQVNNAVRWRARSWAAGSELPGAGWSSPDASSSLLHSALGGKNHQWEVVSRLKAKGTGVPTPAALPGRDGTRSRGWSSLVILNEEQQNRHRGRTPRSSSAAPSPAPGTHRTAGAYGKRRRFGGAWLITVLMP